MVVSTETTVVSHDCVPAVVHILTKPLYAPESTSSISLVPGVIVASKTYHCVLRWYVAVHSAMGKEELSLEISCQRLVGLYAICAQIAIIP